ncbi:MAG: NAD(P)-binding domain-containing protein [Sandaracinaceae bacterium]
MSTRTRLNFETVIVGAGPAGLQLAYHLKRAGRDHVVLERGQPGEFFRRYPRHRALLSINKRFTGYDDPEKNLRWDWNSLLTDPGDDGPTMRDFSTQYFPHADELVAYLQAFAQHHGLPVRSGVEVQQISRIGDVFELDCGDAGVYRANRVVMATGVPRAATPDLPGIELAESYNDVSVDPDDFANQRVLIVGKGNSAFETASNLLATSASVHIASPHPLRFAWKTRFVGHLRAVNNDFLDTYRLKAQNVVIDADIVRLEKRDDGRIAVLFDYKHAREREELLYDRVITCTGFAFDDAIFDSDCRPDLVVAGRFPAQTSTWESVNVPDLFFAGAATQARDFKKTTSAFIHGFRYNTRALFRFLEERYHGVPFPSKPIAWNAAALTDLMIDRINRTSGLWQQFGFLGDVFVQDGDDARHYEELPIAWVRESRLGEREHFVVTLEFGPAADDPFDFARPHRDAAPLAHESEALHPVVRHYLDGKHVGTHHLMEDIAADWSDEVHVSSLRDWLTSRIEDGAASMAEGAE